MIKNSFLTQTPSRPLKTLAKNTKRNADAATIDHHSLNSQKTFRIFCHNLAAWALSVLFNQKITPQKARTMTFFSYPKIFVYCVFSLAVVGGTCPGQSKAGSGITTTEGNTSCSNYCELANDGGDLGACVRFATTISNPEPGHTYEIRYTFRIPEQGDINERILGDEGRPNGVSYTAGNSDGYEIVQNKALRFHADVDITRGLLRKLYNMPKPDKWTYVMLRIEVDVYDVTAGKYMTANRSDAMLMVAGVQAGGFIKTLESMSRFIAEGIVGTSMFELVNRMLKSQENYSAYWNGIEESIGELLDDHHLTAEKQLLLLDIVRPDWVHLKSALYYPIEFLAENGTDKVKEVAESLIDGRR